MDRLKTAASERFPNAVPQNVADALYPAFDPDNKGEVDFIAAAKVSQGYTPRWGKSSYGYHVIE